MFGQSKPKEVANREEIDMRFQTVIRSLERTIAAKDAKIKEEMQNAKAYYKEKNEPEYQRCLKKLNRLYCQKLQREKNRDNIESIQDKIDDLFEQRDLAAAMKEASQSVGQIVSDKEIKNITAQMEKMLDDIGEQTNHISVFMGKMNETIENRDAEIEAPDFDKEIERKVSENFIPRIENEIRSDSSGEEQSVSQPFSL